MLGGGKGGGSGAGIEGGDDGGDWHVQLLNVWLARLHTQPTRLTALTLEQLSAVRTASLSMYVMWLRDVYVFDAEFHRLRFWRHPRG